MWALVVIGIFTGGAQGPSMQIDYNTITTVAEMSGDVTLVESGYATEESCRIQKAAYERRQSMIFQGMKIAVKSVECRDTEVKANEGKGPRA